MERWIGTELQPGLLGIGMNGAMFQMIAHGISSAGMFFMVGVIYDRVHHRNLDEFGGLFGKMPVYGGLAFGIFFAGLVCQGYAVSSAKCSSRCPSGRSARRWP